MLSLTEYREYWQGIARRIRTITGVVPVTVDDGMAKTVGSLPAESVTLFFMPPAATGSGNPDSFRERNECVVFVMRKYDPQRQSAYDVLEITQPVIEAVKAAMLADQAAGCPVMRFEVSTLNTLPETGFFATFAGWSIGFKIVT